MKMSEEFTFLLQWVMRCANSQRDFHKKFRKMLSVMLSLCQKLSCPRVRESVVIILVYIQDQLFYCTYQNRHQFHIYAYTTLVISHHSGTDLCCHEYCQRKATHRCSCSGKKYLVYLRSLHLP